MEGWWAASYVALWILVGMLAIVVVALARQIGTLHLRLGPRGALEVDDEGPPMGEPLAVTETTSLDGLRVQIGGAGRSQLLLFVSPGCRMCEEVLPSLPVIARVGSLAPFVITDLDPAETASAFGDRSLDAPIVPGKMLAHELGVPGTPYVIVSDSLGRVAAKGTVNNLEQLEGLVATAKKRSADRVGSPG